jgi:hypothetical protein
METRKELEEPHDPSVEKSAARIEENLAGDRSPGARGNALRPCGGLGLAQIGPGRSDLEQQGSAAHDNPPVLVGVPRRQANGQTLDRRRHQSRNSGADRGAVHLTHASSLRTGA